MKRLALTLTVSLLCAARTLANGAVGQHLLPDTISYFPYYASQLLAAQDSTTLLSPEALAILARPALYIDGQEGSRSAISELWMPLIFDVDKLALTPGSEALKSTYTASPYATKTSWEMLSTAYTLDPARIAGRLAALKARHRIISEVRRNILRHHPQLIKTTVSMLPQDKLASKTLDAVGYQGELAVANRQVEDKSASTLERLELKRRYWTSHFEGNLHISQNKISDNWYKGGNSSLNLNMRNYLNATYTKGKLKWVNELEWKLGLNGVATEVLNSDDPKAPKKSQTSFRISEDILRGVSNLGFRASKHWFYTVDGQLRTQFLRNTKGDDVVTMPLAPIMLDAGVGMKYEMEWKSRNDHFRRIKLSTNIAPASATLIYVYSDKVHKGRVGLTEDQHFKFRLGSTLRVSMDYNISQTVNWQSRVYYNTSFKHVETEWENRLTLLLTRHLSTMLNLHLRFDDSVITPDKSLDNLLQYNEILSFGFTYRI